MQDIFQEAMNPSIASKINNAGVIAVLVIDELKHTAPLAKALLEGGVDTIELTLRTDVALNAAKLIKREFPEINLGFGTVITVDQVKAIADLGADFAVAPGCNPKIISEAIKHGISFAPGIMTPTDIEIAVEHGCKILKYFPAESSGGIPHLESMSAPYKHLGLRFIPLGGCNLQNALDYLKSPLITAIGGSWIAKQSLIHNNEWDVITANAREISDLVVEVRKNR